MRHCPCAHKQKRRHFHVKITSVNLYIYTGVGARNLYIDEAHTALDIFRFAAFFLGKQEKTGPNRAKQTLNMKTTSNMKTPQI